MICSCSNLVTTQQPDPINRWLNSEKSIFGCLSGLECLTQLDKIIFDKQSPASIGINLFTCKVKDNKYNLRNDKYQQFLHISEGKFIFLIFRILIFFTESDSSCFGEKISFYHGFDCQNKVINKVNIFILL